MKCRTCIHEKACAAWIRHGETLYDDFEYSVEDCPHYKTGCGQWVYDHWCEFKCSVCGEFSNSKPYKGKENYCPNCGADMRGG